MSKMKFTKPRATFDELLAFANAVREAGGGNPLDALMPAVPEDASQCLIAKNLHFNCAVDTAKIPNPEWPGYGLGISRYLHPWVMRVYDPSVAAHVAESLGLEMLPQEYCDEHEYAVILPPEIGAVAEDFDAWSEALIDEWDYNKDDYSWSVDEDSGSKEIERFKEFWPYIEESVKEAYELADGMVNEKGEIIL